MLSCLRRHRLRNNTNRTLYLREQEIDGGGFCEHETRLDPGITIDNFPATKYWNGNYWSGRPSMIVIFVGENQSFGGLFPLQFVKYFELIFEMDEGSNTLIVSGIQAQSTDYFPFRYISLVKTLKHLPCKERPSYLWKYITKREFGRDCSGRPRDIIMISGFEFAEAKNEGNLLPLPGQETMAIAVMINYDGERKKNEEGGFIWSSGAHAKWEAISVDTNNLTVDGVADQICTTLGLNGRETKLLFSRLPEIYTPQPRYISQRLNEFLTFFPYFHVIPWLHVNIVKTDVDDEACGERK